MADPRLLRHRSARLLLLALLLLVFAPAQAAGTYQVELIIFEQGGAEAMNEESWPPDPGQPDLVRALELSSNGQGFQEIGSGSLALGRLANILSGSRGYHVVWHGGWRQPALGPHSAQPLHLLAGRDIGSEYGDAPAREVEGTATLSVSRYLHLNLDLLLRKPQMVAAAPTPLTGTGFEESTVETPVTTRLQSFRLTQSQRMRSSELHYFDHPLFGVLALITPLN